MNESIKIETPQSMITMGTRATIPAPSTNTANDNGLVFSEEDWFSRHEVLWEPIIALLKPKRILEIGSYEGRSTCFMIKECAKHNPVEIHCIDTWQGGEEHAGQDFRVIEERFNNNIQSTINKIYDNKVTIYKYKGLSLVGLCELILTTKTPDQFFDLIYIDGSHQAADVLSDAVLSFRLLKLGGVLIFDDYRVRWTSEIDRELCLYNYPRIAIDAFWDVHKNKLQEIKFDDDATNNTIDPDIIYQLYLRKIKN
jgi:cephalosporin hydroxylase